MSMTNGNMKTTSRLDEEVTIREILSEKAIRNRILGISLSFGVASFTLCNLFPLLLKKGRNGFVTLPSLFLGVICAGACGTIITLRAQSYQNSIIRSLHTAPLIVSLKPPQSSAPPMILSEEDKEEIERTNNYLFNELARSDKSKKDRNSLRRNFY